MAEAPLTIGIHPGGLARAQAERVANLLAAGDADFAVHLEEIPGLGEGASSLHDDHIAENRSEIRHLHSLLREGIVDVVIHRGFDLRGELADDLRIAAILPRSNPYDVLLTPHDTMLDELDAGACVGVVQLRARAQLLDYRDDLAWDLITGDASDWLTALIDRRIEALIAPGAAIESLGLTEQITEIFPPEMIVPGPGSGVLLCACRANDRKTLDRLRPLHDPATATEYTAECAMMESLGGPWELPIGALAQLRSDSLDVHAVVASADGTEILRERHVSAGDDPCLSGAEVAALLLANGAERLLEGIPRSDDRWPDPSIAGELPGRAGQKSRRDVPEELGHDHEFADFEDLLASDDPDVPDLDDDD